MRVQDPRVQNEGSWNSYVDYKIFLHVSASNFYIGVDTPELRASAGVEPVGGCDRSKGGRRGKSLGYF